ncbi:hypothetical protein [Halovivax sp.]|uniref:hypothetical protein n=1 Tax=Halovivax sp. TaxID=1935978 RepID=UPI0025C4BB0B|nr:hypothetical protein [Halovivax sp.]
MAFRVDESASDVRVFDRFDGGVSWIAHPEETMQRASHALEVDGEVWVIDPVDGEGLDDLLAELGDVAGVVVLFDRHRRDADPIARRHDVPVYLPDWFDDVGDELDSPVARFGAELADTGLGAHVVKNGPYWQEAALYDAERRTLVVPEAVGTAAYFRTDDARLGVHPMLRAFPPRDRLSGFDPDRILVGHGEGVATDGAAALEDALAGARRRAPRLYAKALRQLSPI